MAKKALARNGHFLEKELVPGSDACQIPNDFECRKGTLTASKIEVDGNLRLRVDWKESIKEE